MKLITYTFLFSLFVTTANSQRFLLIENFNGNSARPSTNQGWVTVNNSVPVGNNWFFGRPALFKALTGKDSSYYAANFNSVNNLGDISNWLITPTLTFNNGDQLKFSTRTTSASAFADRLQVYLSTADTATDVGNSSSSVGTFSVLLLDINPSLSVNGYPKSWQEYSVAITTPTPNLKGRIGFRYFVTNGGLNGNNSNFIGIDSVTYYTTVDVSVSETGSLASSVLSVYPNPANETVSVEGGSGILEIVNLNGELLLTGNFNGREKIDISFLNKGMYILKLKSKENRLIAIKKLLKN